MRLNICSGTTTLPGYTNVDRRRVRGVQIVCEAWGIGRHVAENSVEAIYCRHGLEHLTQAEGMRALHAWQVALQPGGTLDVIVPDLRYHLAQLDDPNTPSALNKSTSNWAHAMAGLYGWQRHADDLHKWAYDETTLYNALAQAGFVRMVRVDDQPWNLAMRAVKAGRSGTALHSGERQVSETTDGIRPDHVARYHLARQTIPALFDWDHYTRISLLDCACGVGYGTAMLYSGRCGVVGIDNSSEAIAYAEQHYPGPSYFCADALSYTLPQVDVVVSFETIEHIGQDVELLRRFHDCCLDDGGWLICSVPHTDGGLVLSAVPWHRRHYTAESFTSLLEGTGFEIVRRHGQGRLATTFTGTWDGASTMIAVCRKIGETKP